MSQSLYQDIIFKINSNKISEALQEIKLKISENPNDNNLYNFLGVCHVLQNNLEEAIKQFKLCLNLNPNNYDASLNLALNLEKTSPDNANIDIYFKKNLESKELNKFISYGLYLNRKKSKEAEIYLLQAIEINQTSPFPYIGLMDHYLIQNNLQKGLDIGNAALLASKPHEGIFYNLGLIHQKLQNLDLALKYYNQALEYNDKNPNTYNNIGLIHLKDKNYLDATRCFVKAIELHSKFSAAITNLGLCYLENKKYLLALNTFKKSLKINNKSHETYNNLGLLFKTLNNYKIALRYYEKAIRLNQKDFSYYSNYLYTMTFDDNFNQKHYLQEAKKINKIVAKEKKINFHSNLADKNKIGFVSADLRKHPVGYFMKDTIQHLSKNFEIFCYTNTNEEDDLTKDIKLHCSGWRKIFNLTNEEVKKQIIKDKVFFLFDLSGHTSLNRADIFSIRSAPCQISWCGWLASTGLDYMDYIVIDKNIYHKSLQEYFTEKFIILDNIWNAYSMEKIFLENNSGYPALANNHITFGAFHNAAKINNTIIKFWSQILKSNPENKLHLLAKSFGDPQYVSRTIKKFKSHEVMPHQLIFSGSMNRDKFLPMYRNIDLLLDTWPYSGGSSSFETIGMRVPILTLQGNSFLERCGHSINVNIGFEELIAKNINDYVNIATSITVDNFQKIKNKINNINLLKSNLFNHALLAENMHDKLIRLD